MDPLTAMFVASQVAQQLGNINKLRQRNSPQGRYQAGGPPSKWDYLTTFAPAFSLGGGIGPGAAVMPAARVGPQPLTAPSPGSAPSRSDANFLSAFTRGPGNTIGHSMQPAGMADYEQILQYLNRMAGGL